MPAITLPDGSVRRYDGPVTGTTVAADIGPGLARAALASVKQGKYMAFHQAMMGHKGQITVDNVFEYATKVGLNVDQLKKDMNDPAIGDTISLHWAAENSFVIEGLPSTAGGAHDAAADAAASA